MCNYYANYRMVCINNSSCMETFASLDTSRMGALEIVNHKVCIVNLLTSLQVLWRHANANIEGGAYKTEDFYHMRKGRRSLRGSTQNWFWNGCTIALCDHECTIPSMEIPINNQLMIKKTQESFLEVYAQTLRKSSHGFQSLNWCSYCQHQSLLRSRCRGYKHTQNDKHFILFHWWLIIGNLINEQVVLLTWWHKEKGGGDELVWEASSTMEGHRRKLQSYKHK